MAGWRKTTAPTTTVVMTTEAPNSSQTPIRTTEGSFEEKAAMLEKTSGAPLPRARKVTPATSYVSFSWKGRKEGVRGLGVNGRLNQDEGYGSRREVLRKEEEAKP